MFRRFARKPAVTTSATGRSFRPHRTRLFCESLETRLAPASIAWDGGPTSTGTDWLTAANWAGDVLPGIADEAVIGGAFATATINVNGNVSINKLTSSATVQISSGTYTLATASTSAKFTMAGGTLEGAGDLSVSGVFSWTGGTMQGTGKTSLSAAATGTISAATNKFLGRLLENSGTVSYTGSGLFYGPFSGSIGVVNNLAGGVFNSTGDGDFNQFFSSASHAFNNSGTFNRSGAGTTTFSTSISFNNSATVNLTAGTLQLSGAGTHTGPFATSAGTVLQFDSNTNVMSAGSSITGSGTTRLLSGILTANTNLSLVNYDQQGGKLNGSGATTVTTAFTWSGGTMDATGQTNITASATAAISGASNKFLGRVLQNAGTINYTGTGFFFGPETTSPGTLNNLVGAVFNAIDDGDFNIFWGNASHAFNNSGTFNRSGAGITTFTGIAFNNTGTVNLTAGGLALNNGGTDTGAYAVSGGTALEFGGGTHSLSVASSISGAGTTLFSGGTTTVSGTYTVPITRVTGGTAIINSNFSGTTLEVSGGTLDGTGNATVSSTFTWTAGTMQGTGKTTLTAAATGTISNATNKFLGRILENSGVVNYTGSGVFFGPTATAAGVINNLVGGVFNTNGDGDVAIFFGNAGHAINNSGTINRSGAGSTLINNGILSNNNGTVNITAGTLELQGGGTHTGTFAVSPGTVLLFSAFGTPTILAAGTSITGSGVVRLTSGYLTVNGNVSIVNFEQQGGISDGSGTLTITSTWTYSGGYMDGSGQTSVAATGTGTISGAAQKLLGRVLQNAGTITYTGTSFDFGPQPTSPGVLNNLAGATFDIATDGDMVPFWGNSAHAINNAGTFRKSAGTDTDIAVPFNLTGGVEVLTGALNVTAGGSAGGAFNMLFGPLNLTGGTFTILNGAAGAGTGIIVIAGGTVTVSTGNSGSVARLTQRRGTVNGGGTLTVTNSFTFGGGVQSGTGKTVVAAGTTGTLSSASPKFLGRTFENQGTVTYSGSGLQFGIAGGVGVINNLAGAVMNWSGDGDLGVLGGGAHAINNAGTINRSGAGATSVSSGITFTTTGTVNVTAGTLDTAGAYTQTAGTTTLSTGTTLGAATGVNIDGGVLSGVGTISGNLTNKGTVRPGGTGAAGTLTVTGNYTQTATGVLNIELGGTGAGTFDVLAVGGVANLNGTLNVSLINGFNPANGNTFVVLTFASRSGTFSTMTGLNLGGLELDPVFNANNLTLVTQPA